MGGWGGGGEKEGGGEERKERRERDRDSNSLFHVFIGLSDGLEVSQCLLLLHKQLIHSL